MNVLQDGPRPTDPDEIATSAALDLAEEPPAELPQHRFVGAWIYKFGERVPGKIIQRSNHIPLGTSILWTPHRVPASLAIACEAPLSIGSPWPNMARWNESFASFFTL